MYNKELLAGEQDAGYDIQGVLPKRQLTCIKGSTCIKRSLAKSQSVTA